MLRRLKAHGQVLAEDARTLAANPSFEHWLR